jgi:hypothetical protein
MTVHGACAAFGAVSAAALLTVAGLAAPGAQVDVVSDFYHGKIVNVLIGVGAGGEYDLQARLVAKHIGRHIPGNPSVVAQNMTGASGLKMQKDPEFLAEVASLNFDVAPVGGEALQKIVEQVLATPKDLAARAWHLLE